MRSGGTPVRTFRAKLGCLSLTRLWIPPAEGPFFNGTLVPKIQLASNLQNTQKHQLVSPRDLLGSLVWRGDDRATDFFYILGAKARNRFGGAGTKKQKPWSQFSDQVRRKSPWQLCDWSTANRTSLLFVIFLEPPTDTTPAHGFLV